MQDKERVLTERFPQLNELDPEEQMLLAGELFKQASGLLTAQGSTELPRDIMERIESRLNAYLADPSTGTNWEDLKHQLKRGPNR